MNFQFLRVRSVRVRADEIADTGGKKRRGEDRRQRPGGWRAGWAPGAQGRSCAPSGGFSHLILGQEAESAPPNAWSQWASSSPGGDQDK
jgi:hypothetical protein